MNSIVNNNGTQKISQSLGKSASKLSMIKKAMNFGVAAIALKKMYGLAKDIGQEYVDMIETNNLFEVSMGKVVDEYGNLDEAASTYYIRALAFQEKMNEKLGTNKAELQEYQSMYYNMLTSQGIGNDASYMMSESLTKAGYDIASLFNLNVEDAMDKLQSGLAGQVKGLRQLGIDVSESSLQSILDGLGIDRTVTELSYAEKEVARYIAIMQQAGKAQGDFAKTFESPANQIKVFKNQLIELKQVAGSFIVNAFGGILVYVNAIIMAIKRILQFFAALFGFNLSDGMSTGLDTASASVGNLESGLGGATKAAKELKGQLMGFDEINNISAPSSGGSGGTSGGIDPSLLNALTEWDNKMDSITGKAQEYRDAILKALGFTEDMNGNLKWSWDNVNGIVKAIAIGAGIIAGISLLGKIIKIGTALKSAFTIIKGGEGTLSAFGTGVKAIYSAFSTLKTAGAIVISNFTSILKSTHSLKTAFTETGSAILSVTPTWVKVSGGIAGITASSVLAYSALKDLEQGTIGTGEAVTKLGVSMAGGAASGALLGSALGPVGTAIGAVTGAAIAGISGIVGYTTQLTDITAATKKQVEELTTDIKKISEEYNKTTKSIESNRDASLLEIDTLSNLSKEMESMIDSNGKVKEGYEDRVNYILGELNNALGTEYKLTGNQISINGELIGSYSELQGSIKNYIDTKKQQIQAEAYEDIYKESLKTRISLQEQSTKALETTLQAENEYKDAIAKTHSAITPLEKMQAQYNETIAKSNLKKATDAQKELQEELAKTEEKIQEAEKGFTNAYESMNKTANSNSKDIANVTESSMLIMNKAVTTNTNSASNSFITNAQKSKEEWETNISEIRKSTEESLKNANKTIETRTEEIKNGMNALGEKSSNSYKNGIQNISQYTEDELTDTSNQIQGNKSVVNSMLNLSNQTKKSYNVDGYSLGYNTSSGISSGITGGKTLATTAISKLGSNLLTTFKNVLNIHSPSKEMSNLSKFIPEGVAVGIKNNSKTAINAMTVLSDSITKEFKTDSKDLYSEMSLLSEGIKVPNASINATSYVDYGTISGNISANNNVSVSGNIIDGIAKAVSGVIQNINVNIEAKTEEGVIVKKASQGFRDYVRQTGELPFPVPVS